MSIDDRLRTAAQGLESQLHEIEVPPPPSARPDYQGPVLAVAVAALVTALLVIYAPRTPDVNDDVTPPPVISATTSPTTELDGDEPSESIEPSESASLVDGAILLPDGFHPGDAAESDNGLMLVRAERRPHEPGTPPQEDGVVMAIDQLDGDVVWVAELSDGASLLEVSDERVFVAHYWTGGVTALDLSSGDVLWTAVPQLPFEVGDGPDGRQFIPNDIEAGFGSLWMATARGAVARIDAMNGEIIDVFAFTEQLQPGDVPVYVGDIAISDRHVWVAGGTSGFFRINPGSGNIDRTTSDQLGHDASSVVAVGADVLVGGGNPVDASGVVSLVDSSGLEPVASTAFEDFATVVETHDRPAVWTGGVLRPIEPDPLAVGEPFDAFFDDDRWLAPSDASWIVSTEERLLIPIPRETGAAQPSGDAGPMFGVGIYTDALLLFDNGLDGILAVEPDERLAARSTLEGQRAGNEPYSMVRVGDSLVVGWSEIFSVDIATRDATRLGLATIFVPAAEPDRVWMIKGAIGLGTSTVWQVAINGEQLTDPVTLDIEGFPAYGIPGGLAVETDDGIQLWDAASQTARSLPADSENSQVLDASGNDLVWCRADCSELVVTDLSTMTSEGFVIPDGFTFVTDSPYASGQHLSPDGRFVAALVRRTNGDDTSLWLLDRTNENITTVSDEETEVDFLTWGPDWTQIFATSYSYGLSETTVWRYDLETGHFASVTLPFGGALTPIAVDDTVAGSYITGEPGENSRCERITDLASAGDSDCWFGF